MVSSRVLLIFLSLHLSVSGDAVDGIINKLSARLTEYRNALPISKSTIDYGFNSIGAFYSPIHSKSEICRNHSEIMLRSIKTYELWAMKMLDAGSKPPSGLMDGHSFELGDFDMCLSVEAPNKMFAGQYCIVETKGLLSNEFAFFTFFKRVLNALKVNLPMFSICVPSTCSPEDVMTHMNVTFNKFNASAVVKEFNCNTIKSEPLKAGEWAFTIFVTFLFLLVFVGTLHDINVKTDKNYYLVAFSLKANIPVMLDTEVKSKFLSCLNGLRVIAMIWVITNHRYIVKLSYANVQFLQVLNDIKMLAYSLIFGGALNVDIFFFLSGFLVTYTYLRKLQMGEKIELHQFYLGRYFRLIPNFAFIIFFVVTIAWRVTDGPLWNPIIDFVSESCLDRWWNTLLLIHNYTQPTKMCLGYSWYLAADFQMYVISPLLLIPLYKKPKLGLILTGLALFATTLAELWTVYVFGLRAGGPFSIDMRTEPWVIKDYYVTHVRSAPFVIGVGVGYLILKIKQGHVILKISRECLWAGWLISTFFILFPVLFNSHFHQTHYVHNAFVEIVFLVFQRHLFTLGISWVVLACCLGHGGILNTFLSWKAFIPISRLTYSAYLLHMLNQVFITFSSRVPENDSALSLLYEVLADFTLTYLTSTVLYLLVECPCSNILNIIFLGINQPKKTPEQSEPTYTSSTELPVYKESTQQ